MTDGRVRDNEDPERTSSSLLVRVREKDPQAWRRFVDLYGPLLLRWCRQAGLQEADAADVAQEVFRSVSAAIADFRHDQKGDTLRGWLRTITRNKISDWARRKPPGGNGAGGSDAQTRLFGVADACLPEADEGSEQEDRFLVQRRAVESVLAECEEATRQAFLRVVAQGQAPADVARDLGLTVNAVYLARSRLLRRIREEFAGLVEL